MTENQKPVPIMQPWTREFWAAAKEGKLLVQHCKECESNIFFPKKVCPECWSKNLTWIESSGKAIVYSFTEMIDMVEPVFWVDVPYIIAQVDLEEGIPMTTRIVNCKIENVKIGMEVEIVFEKLTDEFSMPYFQPADPNLRLAPLAEEICEIEGDAAKLCLCPDNYQAISYEVGGMKNAVCTITLNRPDKLNAINKQMATELIDAFRRVREEPGVGVVVLAGAGAKAFCTGGDLEIFPSLAEHQQCLNWLAHDGLDVQKAISGCEKVVICKIDGHCLAGGLEIALACDLLYAKESACMGATEINMGVLPGWGGTARLPRAMPIFRAREIIYSGRKDYTAKEMYEMGLLTRVFPDHEFEVEFQKIVDNIGSKKPIALRMGKEVMARSVDGCDIETALAVERNSIQWLVYAPDIQGMLDQFRGAPNTLLEHQKQSNIASDKK